MYIELPPPPALYVFLFYHNCKCKSKLEMVIYVNIFEKQMCNLKRRKKTFFQVNLRKRTNFVFAVFITPECTFLYELTLYLSTFFWRTVFFIPTCNLTSTWRAWYCRSLRRSRSDIPFVTASFSCSMRASRWTKLLLEKNKLW